MIRAFFLALAITASAEPSVKNVKPLIWTSGHYNSLKGVFSPKEYDFMDRETKARELHEQGFLRPTERDSIFRKLKLESKLTQLDDLDKDLLVANARYYSVAELRKQYPMLTFQQLRQLKAEVERIK